MYTPSRLLAHAAIYPTHPLIQTTKATEYHGMEFLFRIAFYIHIYTPTHPLSGRT